MGRMDGKVAIVTGGASGLGRATATLLAREGAHVVVADVNEVAGTALAKELGAGARFTSLDVRDEAAWRRVVEEALAELGRLDVLVNNAGVVVLATIEETTLEQWQRVQAVNSDGVFLGCKHAIPAMLRGGGGSIVNLSSTAGMMGTPAFAAYAASKGAVRSLTKTVAVHCKQRGYPIRCNSIHPGGIDTPMTQGLPAAAAEAAPLAVEALRNQPTTPLGQPEDVAELALYLASDAAHHVNGAEIAIDAGLTAG
ncbi:MAG: glucose 1-dehydrogenase [Myxococcota bacterium]